MAKPVPGWYYGWNIVIATIVSQIAANALIYNCFSLFVRGWSVDLHVPVSQLQLCVTALALLCALFSPIVGAMADRYPARRLLLLGLAGTVLFYVAASFVTAGWQLIALYGLLAPIALSLAASLVTSPLIARWFVRRLGLALGLSSFGFGMAGVLLPPMISAFLPTLGWRWIWRFAALFVAVVVIPLVALLIRDRPTEREGLHYILDPGQTPQSAVAAGDTQAVAPAVTWREIIRHRNFWLVVCLYLPIMGAYSSVTQNLVPYAMSHGFAQRSAGPLLSLLSLAHIVATLALGALSDRFGNRLPFAGLSAVVAVGLSLLAFGHLTPLIIAGCMCVGCGGGFGTLLGAALAREFGAGAVGRAFGMSMFFIPIGALSPALVARIQENTGSYQMPLLGLALVLTAGAVLSFALKENPLIGRSARPQH
jgi:MFS family permease